MREPKPTRRFPSAIERLAAEGPFPPAEQGLMLYGRLLGAWDVEWMTLDERGAVVTQRHGEWHFAWVLGGRGVQDVIWAVGEPPEKDGTTLRCWDQDRAAWRAVFMSPGDGEFATLLGRQEGDAIVQEVISRSPDGRPPDLPERWRFSDIEATSFLWQAEKSHDGGRTWTTTHQIHARRQGP